jgi:hypothetical protein
VKINASFEKSGTGDVTATISLERGNDDPGMISIDGMARAFESSRRIEVSRKFSHGSGNDAKEWAEKAVEDIKHQIDEFRTSLPKNYDVEY